MKEPKQKRNKTSLMTFYVEPQLKEEYTAFARKFGYSMSGRFRMFMINDMKENETKYNIIKK